MFASLVPGRSSNGRGPDRRLAVILCTLLAFGAGATEAITFERLGNVFAGVMTGNLVLFGVSLGSGTSPVTGRVAVAIAAFAIGVFGSGLIAARSAQADVVWPSRVTTVLEFELVLILGFAVGWQIADSDPAGTAQVVLLGAAALAMGLQSGAVLAIGIEGLSTTYVTGTLTSVLSTLAHAREVRATGVAILGALLAGATLAALALAHAPRLAPVLPLAALAGVIASARRASRSVAAEM